MIGVLKRKRERMGLKVSKKVTVVDPTKAMDITMAWILSRLVFIPKSSRPDNTHTKKFIPISLTLFTLKTLEKLVGINKRKWALSGNPIYRKQHVYQPWK